MQILWSLQIQSNERSYESKIECKRNKAIYFTEDFFWNQTTFQERRSVNAEMKNY